MIDKLKTILHALCKPIRDLASILYDDLEFRAMSLPRVAAAVLTGMIVWCVAVWVRADRMFLVRRRLGTRRPHVPGLLGTLRPHRRHLGCVSLQAPRQPAGSGKV